MQRLIQLTVCFVIAIGTAGHAQAQRSGTSGDVAGPADQMICRRFVRIGSLVDSYRVCKTRGEWNRERQNIRNGVMNRNSCQTEGVGGSTPGSYGGQINCGI